MAKPPAGVEFIQEGDRRVTARHINSGVAAFDDTEAEALRQLADALDNYLLANLLTNWIGENIL